MNYKILEYKEEFGENPLTDEMREILSGLSLDEQIDYFEMENADSEEKFSYGESRGERERHCTYTLRYKMRRDGFEPTVRGLVVNEGFIVGWIYDGDRIGLLNEWYCTYWACEDDGTGSTTVADYYKLVFTGKKNCDLK